MKLIQTKNYLLLIDEEAEINEGEYLYDKSFGISKARYNTFEPTNNKTQWHLLAYYPLTTEAKELDLPLLPNPFEKEIDIEKLAQEVYREYPTNPKDKPDWTYNRDIHVHKKRKAFIKGYKAAQSKQFSLEDVKKAFEEGHDSARKRSSYKSNGTYEEDLDKFIQSLSTQQLPKEFIPEYEREHDDTVPFPKMRDSKTIKTITNSEGKKVLVGTYKY